MHYQTDVGPLALKSPFIKVVVVNSQGMSTYHCQRGGMFSILNEVVYGKSPLGLAPTA